MLEIRGNGLCKGPLGGQKPDVWTTWSKKTGELNDTGWRREQLRSFQIFSSVHWEVGAEGHPKMGPFHCLVLSPLLLPVRHVDKLVVTL